MKISSSILLVNLIVTSLFAQNYQSSYLILKNINPKDTSIALQYYKIPALGLHHDSLITHNFNKDNYTEVLTFSIKRQIEFYTSNHDMIFLEPGDSLILSFRLDKKGIFSGKGAEKNRFYHEFNKLTDPFYNRMIRKRDKLSYEEVRDQYLEHMNKELQVVKMLDAKYNVSQGFVNILNSRIKYEKYRSLYFLALRKKAIDKWIQDVSEIDLNNDHAAEYNSMYNDVVQFYIRSKFQKEGIRTEEPYWVDLFRYGKDNLTGLTRDNFLTGTLEHNNTNIELFDLLYLQFKENVKDAELISYVEKLNDRIKDLKKMTLPADAKILEGSFDSFQQILDVYNGKVVYIDFWASWCKPCIAAMPASMALQEYFKDEDVVFLFIGFQDKLSPWQTNIKKHQIIGDHILLDEGMVKQLKDKYKLTSIPRYMLVDRNGKVINDKAPKPDDEEVKKLIRLAIKEN